MSNGSLLNHSELHLRPDPSRTVIRPFDIDYPEAFKNEAHSRTEQIVERVLSLDGARRLKEHEPIIASLAERYRGIERILLRRFDEICQRVPAAQAASREAALAIGAYFSEEYAYQAAALFNPGMVLRADQTGAPPGGVCFLLSLRGIGEGHVSSVTFRTGTWSPADGFALDEASNQAISPRIDSPVEGSTGEMTRIVCEGSEDVSESVLFPVTASQQRGIEDLRLVRFVEEDGHVEYLGTYTAFDGRDARSELLRATGFRTFEMYALKGSAAAAKGMALFPRKVGGRFMMLGRQDSESIWLLASDDLYSWEGGTTIVSPRFPWEFVQMGNCGSPIEIEEGWLVLTHGVGMARNYCMGACLLDKKDPSRLLARTREPILRPSPNERHGYVPNVVYSCGSIAHERTLLLPYGVADTFVAFATASIDDLLEVMELPGGRIGADCDRTAPVTGAAALGSLLVVDREVRLQPAVERASMELSVMLHTGIGERLQPLGHFEGIARVAQGDRRARRHDAADIASEYVALTRTTDAFRHLASLARALASE